MTDSLIIVRAREGEMAKTAEVRVDTTEMRLRGGG
jgi:hypothetical protein